MVETQPPRLSIMHILFTINDAYAPHLAVTIVSLLHSQRKERELSFHVISSDLSETAKRKLEELKKIRPFTITYYEESQIGIDFKLFPIRLKYISHETYYRCFAHELIKDTDRILHLDVDLLVRRDLSELWEINLGDNYATGVRYSSPNGSHLTIAGFNPWKNLHFHAGVNLLNLKKMKEENITLKILHLCEEYRDFLRAQDQDVLNIIFRGKVIEVSPTYNFTTTFQEVLKADPDAQANLAFKAAQKNPHIIHFSRRIKPWHKRCELPYASLYWQYIKETPWANCVPESIPLKEQFFSYIQNTAAYRTIKGYLHVFYGILYRPLIRHALEQNRKRNFNAFQTGLKLLTRPLRGEVPLLYQNNPEIATFTRRASQAHAVLLWGTTFSYENFSCLVRGLFYNRPLILATESFVSSVDDGQTRNYGLSALLDTYGLYSEEDMKNIITTTLDSTWQLLKENENEAREAMDFIREHHISRHNSMPPQIYSFNKDKKYANCILVVIRKEDTTINTVRMLEDALDENRGSLILLRTPSQASYDHLCLSLVDNGINIDNLSPLIGTYNHISIIHAVDKIYTTTDQMGLEGLICQKQVFCYGTPFYAGWGLTIDRSPHIKRNCTRKLEEIFYASYIKYALYFSPEDMNKCCLLSLMKIIAQKLSAKNINKAAQ